MYYCLSLTDDLKELKEGGEEGVGGEEDEDGDVDMERGGSSNKRPFPDGDNNRRQRKKKKKLPGPVLPKNALMQLNEIKPGLEFKQVGQSWTCSRSHLYYVLWKSMATEFGGSGNTKKKAKLIAAEKALSSFVQFPNASEAAQALGTADCTG